MADGDAVSNQGDVQHVTAIPRRYVLVILSLFALFICSVHRVNLSIAIVAMTTNHSAPTNGTKIYVSCPFFQSITYSLVCHLFRIEMWKFPSTAPSFRFQN